MMNEVEVRRLVAEAVRRERRAWALLMVTVLALFSALQRPLLARPVAKDSSDTSNLRRLLQETPQQSRREALRALRAQLNASNPAAEPPSVLPSIMLPPAQSPASEYNYGLNTTSLSPNPGCICPPGPQGLPGTPAPEFLARLFSYDETTGTLTIAATTLQLSGSIVVEGYAGVKQSLFVGGSPSTGAPSTEVGAGTVLLYGEGGGTVSGFDTGPDGFQLAKVVVQGELYEDSQALNQPKRVSTGIF